MTLHSYAKYSHAVSGYTPRHDEVAERMPKADEDGAGKDVHYPSGLYVSGMCRIKAAILTSEVTLRLISALTTRALIGEGPFEALAH